MHSRSGSKVLYPIYFHLEHMELMGLIGPNTQVPSLVKIYPFEQLMHLSSNDSYYNLTLKLFSRVKYLFREVESP